MKGGEEPVPGYLQISALTGIPLGSVKRACIGPVTSEEEGMSP